MTKKKPDKFRLYVIGPVTGHKERNYELFRIAKQRLEEAGYTVIIPHDFIKDGTKWNVAMRMSIAMMLTKADGVAQLDGNWTSTGAMLERAIAFDLGMPLGRVKDWVSKPLRRPAYIES